MLKRLPANPSPPSQLETLQDWEHSGADPTVPGGLEVAAATTVRAPTSDAGVPVDPAQATASTAAVLLCGVLCGFGLSLSSMVQPEAVLRFFRFEDAGLILALCGATSVALLAYQLFPRWLAKPPLGDRFDLHHAYLNRNTIIGAAIFGIGWGICGLSPGPAVASLGTGSWHGLWALLAIAAGAWIQGWLAVLAPDASVPGR